MEEYYDVVMNNGGEKIVLSPERIESLNLQMEKLLLHGVSKIKVGKENLNITSSFYEYNIKRRCFFQKKSFDFSNFAKWSYQNKDEIKCLLLYIALNEDEAAEYIREYQDEDKLAWFCYALINISMVTFDKIYNLLHFAAKYHPQGVSAQTMKDFFTREIALNIGHYPYRNFDNSPNYAHYGRWLLENFNSVPLSLKYKVACAIPNPENVDISILQKQSNPLKFMRAWLIINILFVMYLACVYLWVSPSNITLRTTNLLIAIIFCGIGYGLYRKFRY